MSIVISPIVIFFLQQRHKFIFFISALFIQTDQTIKQANNIAKIIRSMSITVKFDSYFNKGISIIGLLYVIFKSNVNF